MSRLLATCFRSSDTPSSKVTMNLRNVYPFYLQEFALRLRSESFVPLVGGLLGPDSSFAPCSISSMNSSIRGECPQCVRRDYFVNVAVIWKKQRRVAIDRR